MFPQISCDRRSYLEIYSILHPHPSHHIRGNINTRYPPFLPILPIISGAIWTPDIHLSFPFFPSYKGQFKHQTSLLTSQGQLEYQIFFLSFSSIPSFQGQLKHQIFHLSFLPFQGQFKHQIFILSFLSFQGQLKHQIFLLSFLSFQGQLKHQIFILSFLSFQGQLKHQIFLLSFLSFQGQLKHQILILSFLSFQGQYEHQIFVLSFQFLPLFQGQFKHQISIPFLQQPFFLNQIFKFYLKIKKYILTLYIKRFNTNLLI